jgi:hypothetical protein
MDVGIENPDLLERHHQLFACQHHRFWKLTKSPLLVSSQWTTNFRAADDSISESSCEEMKISGGNVSQSASREDFTERLDLYSLRPSADWSSAPSMASQLAQRSSVLIVWLMLA